ncbi:MAG: hypothetical protein IT376_09210 [Polyangiaceae bacterium]|nr:hypothetical protein [Polyangiaceae bacterium]
MIRRGVAIAWATWAAAAAANAQVGRPVPRARPHAQLAPPLEAAGLPAADRLLAASGDEGRMRAGVDRLATLGSTTALERLEAVTSDAARPPAVRLAAVRALGRHGAHPVAEAALARVLGGVAWAGDPLDYGSLARGTAALALAAVGTPSGIRILAKALGGSGPAADAAIEAFVAYPPADLAGLAPRAAPPGRAFVALAMRLGDQRAFGPLRRAVRHGRGALQAEALVALTWLGDLETVEVARRWRTRPPSPAHQAAAARVLALARAPGGDGDVGEPVRGEAPRSAAGLERWLDGEATRVDAMARLASSTTDDTLAALLRASSRAPTRALALRALALRAAAAGHGEAPLDDSIERSLRATDPALRAAAAWSRALLDPARAAALVESPDPVIARGAARAASGAALAAAARRLVAEVAGANSTAFALALRDDDAAALVPTEILVRLLERPATAPIAAWRLAQRDLASTDRRVRDALASPDVLLRAHAARGLAASRASGVVGRLDDAYATEIEPTVRRAIVAALAARPERARRRTLGLAAALEPDIATRELARRALLAGPLALDDARGRDVAWVSVAPETGLPAPDALILTESWAWPAALDPDGVAVLPGLPTRDFTVRLVAAAERDQAPGSAPR